MASKKYQITQLQADSTLLTLHPETSADIVLETADKKIMTGAERTKLASVESNAQVNKIEVVKVNGSPLTISNKEVDIKVDMGSYIPTSEKGSANGVVPLNASKKIEATYLPSYVDDVLEFTNKTSFPSTGESGKIYIAKDTNITYRWGGSAYVEISSSLALGETSSTAYAGDKGKANADNIANLKSRMTSVESANSTQNTEIANIKNGTTKVGKAITADSATAATKLSTARTISVSNDVTGSASFDGSANVTLSLTLKNVGTAGTYSAVTTDVKGRVVAGAQVFEIGATGQATPNSNLAVGGLFYKEI